MHEKQANRRRSEKLGAAQSVHAWSRSTAYTYPQCSVLCARSSKSSKLHGQNRKECAASRLHVRETSVLHSASGLPRYLPACRNVAANRRVLAHWCKIIEACKCKQRFSVRCLYALRSHLRVHQTEVPR